MGAPGIFGCWRFGATAVVLLVLSASADDQVGSLDGAGALGLRGATVMQHNHAQMSFAEVLSKSMKSEAFKKQVDSTVPMMCEGSDAPDKCRGDITKALACTNFLDKAKSMDTAQLQGVENFIKRCDGIERRVPNLSSVMHWVQNPETVFKAVVAKAQANT